MEQLLLDLPEEEPPSKDWHWQLRNRIRSIKDLNIQITEDLLKAEEKFPIAITPYYLSLIKKFDYSDPVFAMSVPQCQELLAPTFLSNDPLAEEHDMPIPNLVHRYRDRALVLVTDMCAMYCRFCTRKRVAGQIGEKIISQEKLNNIVSYLKSHEEIKDVIISGGDAFTISTSALENIILSIRKVKSVEIIRIGTRTPVTLPMRIDNELINMLKKYQPIWINTHFNHPVEITEQSKEACEKLVDAGFPVGNQTVLLKGVNDRPEIIEKLCRNLITIRVRPYYLFQCDLVNGVEHFRTNLNVGLKIMEHLRGRLSGLAIPNFVVDAPNGGGKIELLPNSIISMDKKETILENFQGKLISYPEPIL